MLQLRKHSRQDQLKCVAIAAAALIATAASVASRIAGAAVCAHCALATPGSKLNVQAEIQALADASAQSLEYVQDPQQKQFKDLLTATPTGEVKWQGKVYDPMNPNQLIVADSSFADPTFKAPFLDKNGALIPNSAFVRQHQAITQMLVPNFDFWGGVSAAALYYL